MADHVQVLNCSIVGTFGAERPARPPTARPHLRAAGDRIRISGLAGDDYLDGGSRQRQRPPAGLGHDTILG